MSEPLDQPIVDVPDVGWQIIESRPNEPLSGPEEPPGPEEPG